MKQAAQPRGRREEYTEATRNALLSAGRDAFGSVGFTATGIETVARAARVTRGAFYHHFTDKKALFDAVVVQLQIEATDTIARRAKPEKEIWDRLQVGIDAYLDVCLEPAYARIVLQEGAAVLGNLRYREIDALYPTALLMATLEALHARDELAIDDTNLLGRMVESMVCELAMQILGAENPRELRISGQAIIARLFESYRRS